MLTQIYVNLWHHQATMNQVIGLWEMWWKFWKYMYGFKTPDTEYCQVDVEKNFSSEKINIGWGIGLVPSAPSHYINQCWSSLGYFFRTLFRSAEEDGGHSASGRHLGWPHLHFRSSSGANELIQDGGQKQKGRHLPLHSAIGSEKSTLGLGWHHFRRRHLGWRHPRWRRWEWRLEDIGTPVKTPSKRLPRQSSHAVLTKGSKICPVDVWLYFYFWEASDR